MAESPIAPSADTTWGSGRAHCPTCTYPYCACGSHHATIAAQLDAPPAGMVAKVYQCHQCGARFRVDYPGAAYGALQRVRQQRQVPDHRRVTRDCSPTDGP